MQSLDLDLSPEGEKVLKVINNTDNRECHIESINKLIDFLERKLKTSGTREIFSIFREIQFLRQQFSELYNKLSSQNLSESEMPLTLKPVFAYEVTMQIAEVSCIVYIQKSKITEDRFFVTFEEDSGLDCFTRNMSASEIKGQLGIDVNMVSLEKMMTEPNDMSLGQSLRRFYQS